MTRHGCSPADAYHHVRWTRTDSPDGGTGLTTTQTIDLPAKGNMTGLDWTNTWVTTAGYPRLRWNADVVLFEDAIDSTNSPMNESEAL